MKSPMRGVWAVLSALLYVGGVVAGESSGEGAAPDNSSVLLWWVNTSDAVDDGSTVGTLLSRGLPEGKNGQHVTVARIRVYNKDMTPIDNAGEAVWLNLYNQTDPDNDSGWVLSNSPDLYFGNESKDPPPIEKIGPSWADFAGYGSSEYAFAIELGFLYGDDDEWISMATGAIVGYDALEGFRRGGIIEKPEMTPWSSSYSVPEPSSGLLLLVGGALLALKRRNGGRVCL